MSFMYLPPEGERHSVVLLHTTRSGRVIALDAPFQNPGPLRLTSAAQSRRRCTAASPDSSVPFMTMRIWTVPAAWQTSFAKWAWHASDHARSSGSACCIVWQHSGGTRCFKRGCNWARPMQSPVGSRAKGEFFCSVPAKRRGFRAHSNMLPE